jgi:alkanesulfonate monooxygenase SsuD/methylene tetrahydromethanopterin reductase-like flavin-dependent oxidoreductase (luciferase family)
MTLRLSCVVRAEGLSTAEAIARVQLAESLGYDAVYSAQAAHRDALALTAAYAQATTRIGLGTSIYPIYWSAPAAMAMTATTIQELSAGRLRLGLGVSHPRLVEGLHSTQIGKPVAEAREYVGLLRAALDGDVPRSGARWSVGHRQTDVPAPVPRVPIHLAALRRRMLRMAAEVADGIFLVNVPPEYVRDVVLPEVTRVREAAGLGIEAFDIAVIVNCNLTDDVDGAVADYRAFLVWYLMMPYYQAVFEDAGYGHVVAAFRAAGGDEAAAAAAMDDDFIRSMAALGPADELHRLVERFADAGATSVLIAPAVQPAEGPASRMTAPDAEFFEAVVGTAIAADRHADA